MKPNEVIEITKEEAIKAVEAYEGEQLHCFMGPIGADWDKQSVIDLINGKSRIAWADNLFDHNLAVIADGRLHNFDIQH